MHGLGAGALCRRDDLVDDQIGRRRRRGTDVHRLVRHVDVQGVAVGVAIDRDRGDAHALRGTDDAAGDFAAIGDENLTEHGPHDTPTALLLPCRPPQGGGQRPDQGNNHV